jgi:hypothetical protein
MLAVAAAIGAGLLAGALTVREPKLKGSWQERAIVAAAWPLGAVVATLIGPSWLPAGVAAVYLAACIGTWGRPGLLIDQYVDLWPAGNEGLQKRRVFGLVAVTVTAVVAAIIIT